MAKIWSRRVQGSGREAGDRGLSAGLCQLCYISMDSKYTRGPLGALSGVAAAALFQPLENIKVNMMLPPGDLSLKSNFLSNLITTYRYIFKTEGVRGLYQGVAASSMRSGLGSLIYFETLRRLENLPFERGLAYNFFNSLVARLISTALTNPLSIVQTRYELVTFHEYNSMGDAFAKIYRKQGFNTFLKGGLTACIKQSLFAGFYYMIYEELKSGGMARFPSGILSGLVATVVSHPLEIIRAELQTEGVRKTHQERMSLSAEFKTMVRELKRLAREKELFSGLAPRLVKKPLVNTMTFYLFEMFEDKIKQ